MTHKKSLRLEVESRIGRGRKDTPKQVQFKLAHFFTPFLRVFILCFCYASKIEEDMIIDRSLYIGKPLRKTTDVDTVLGILSSKLMIWLFKHESNEFDALFPKVRLAEFKKLPIPKDLKKFAEVGKVVSRIITAKAKGSDTKAMEIELDQLTYQLYNLTPEEISIVEKSAITESAIATS